MQCAIQFEGSLKQVVFVDTPTFTDFDDTGAGLDVETKIRDWARQT